jgi:hypothetical protein
MSKNGKSKANAKERALLNVEVDGDISVITVRLEGGHKEKWTYEREEIDGLVSYSMIGREDAR